MPQILCSLDGFPVLSDCSNSSAGVQEKTNIALPVWYQTLLDKGFQRPWLDGISSSTVCSFDANTARCGVILRYPNNDRHQPNIEWFLQHHIPCWYHLSRHTEDHFRATLKALLPPVEKLQSALTMLFAEPRMPLVAYVFKSYSVFEWGDYAIQARNLLDMRSTPSVVLGMCGYELSKHRHDPRAKPDWHDPVVREQLLTQLDGILAEREARLRENIFSGQLFIQQGMIARDTFDGLIRRCMKVG